MNIMGVGEALKRIICTISLMGVTTILEGEWRIGEALQITIVNMYNAGPLTDKRVVWEEVREKRRTQNTKALCVVEDFNSIRRSREKRNVGNGDDHKREVRRFNDFIENSELVDIPMVGRKYTQYKPNGLIKIKIDQILVSREWLDKWSDSKCHILDKLMFDHCALVLKTDITD